jgi:hypothetical protein
MAGTGGWVYKMRLLASGLGRISLIGGGLLQIVDHKHFEGAAGLFQVQSEVVNGGRDYGFVGPVQPG